jgi:hypothetical protein
VTDELPPYDFKNLPRQLLRAFAASPESDRWEFGLLLTFVEQMVKAGIDPISKLHELASQAKKRMPKRKAWEPTRGRIGRDWNYAEAAQRFRELERLGEAAVASRPRPDAERSLILADALLEEKTKYLRSLGLFRGGDPKTLALDGEDQQMIASVLNACPTTKGLRRLADSYFEPEAYAWEATLKEFPWVEKMTSVSLRRQGDRAIRKRRKGLVLR